MHERRREGNQTAPPCSSEGDRAHEAPKGPSALHNLAGGRAQRHRPWENGQWPVQRKAGGGKHCRRGGTGGRPSTADDPVRAGGPRQKGAFPPQKRSPPSAEEQHHPSTATAPRLGGAQTRWRQSPPRRLRSGAEARRARWLPRGLRRPAEGGAAAVAAATAARPAPTQRRGRLWRPRLLPAHSPATHRTTWRQSCGRAWRRPRGARPGRSAGPLPFPPPAARSSPAPADPVRPRRLREERSGALHGPAMLPPARRALCRPPRRRRRRRPAGLLPALLLLTALAGVGGAALPPGCKYDGRPKSAGKAAAGGPVEVKVVCSNLELAQVLPPEALPNRTVTL